MRYRKRLTYFTREILPMLLVFAVIAVIVVLHMAAAVPPVLISLRSAGLIP